jgi:hypothetical protein
MGTCVQLMKMPFYIRRKVINECLKRNAMCLKRKSESDPIGFVRILEQKYTYRIGLVKLFRSRIGLR